MKKRVHSWTNDSIIQRCARRRKELLLPSVLPPNLRFRPGCAGSREIFRHFSYAAREAAPAPLEGLQKLPTHSDRSTVVLDGTTRQPANPGQAIDKLSGKALP
jgi:hypothetical protein